MWGKSAEGWGGRGRTENVAGEDSGLVRKD